MTFWDSVGVAVVTALLTSVVVGPSAAFVTAYLSLKRYRAEKWWDKKAEAYATILDSMHDIIERWDRELEGHITDSGPSQERMDELRALSGKALAEIAKRARVGSFLISNEAERLLTEMQKDLERAKREPDWFEFTDTSLAVALEKFRAIRDEARRDLELTPVLTGMDWATRLAERVRSRANSPDTGGVTPPKASD